MATHTTTTVPTLYTGADEAASGHQRHDYGDGYIDGDRPPAPGASPAVTSGGALLPAHAAGLLKASFEHVK
ncbi:MAG: hypothetical protein DLM60_15980 [Pseudonocardiales bacterium]|nr:MAG: hypothetical protein DLM60_15980 [Pseudonocardiales bacterium]